MVSLKKGLGIQNFFIYVCLLFKDQTLIKIQISFQNNVFFCCSISQIKFNFALFIIHQKLNEN